MLAGIDAAVAVGFDPVKVNVVLMAGVNDDEIVDFARFGRDRGVIVRFIEFMPLDADGRWDGSDVVGREPCWPRSGPSSRSNRSTPGPHDVASRQSGSVSPTSRADRRAARSG
ncbi:MAG: hypothetical protein V9E94_14655 [Microthrixaceae bacterium]